MNEAPLVHLTPIDCHEERLSTASKVSEEKRELGHACTVLMPTFCQPRANQVVSDEVHPLNNSMDTLARTQTGEVGEER